MKTNSEKGKTPPAPPSINLDSSRYFKNLNVYLHFGIVSRPLTGEII